MRRDLLVSAHFVGTVVGIVKMPQGRYQHAQRHAGAQRQGRASADQALGQWRPLFVDHAEWQQTMAPRLSVWWQAKVTSARRLSDDHLEASA
jgi:hypothetical protein